MVDEEEEEGGVQRKYTYDPIIRCQPQTEITVNDSLTAASADSLMYCCRCNCAASSAIQF